MVGKGLTVREIATRLRVGKTPVVRLAFPGGGRVAERQTPPRVQERAPDAGESGRHLQELTDQLRATQTRLGHAKLALGEAVRTAQARQEELAGLRKSLDEAETTLVELRAGLKASKPGRQRLEELGDETRHPGSQGDEHQPMAIRRKRGRPLGSTNLVRDQVPASEPEPVKWWSGA